MQNTVRLIFIFTLYVTAAIAQSDTLPITTSKQERYFKLNYDNDFFSATDRYYTQGIYLEFIIPIVKKSPLSKLLIPLGKHATNYYGITLEQDVFTPRSIRVDRIYYTERPFSGVFLFSHTLASINKEKKLRLNTRLDIGLIGPEAMGEEEQKGVHHALNNIQPQGWEYQISTDFIINYTVKYEKGLIAKNKFECIGYATSRIGSLYDDVGAGILLRKGYMSSYFQNLGLSRNQKSETGKHCQAYLYSKGEVKAVAYNATLQGGMFNKNSIYTLPSSSINRLVATAYVGIVLNYKRVSVEYTKAYLSKEFKTGLPHGWGHCTISVCF